MSCGGIYIDEVHDLDGVDYERIKTLLKDTPSLRECTHVVSRNGYIYDVKEERQEMNNTDLRDRIGLALVGMILLGLSPLAGQGLFEYFWKFQDAVWVDCTPQGGFLVMSPAGLSSVFLGSVVGVTGLLLLIMACPDENSKGD